MPVPAQSPVEFPVRRPALGLDVDQELQGAAVVPVHAAAARTHAGGEGVELAEVELVEVAVGVDEDVALEGLAGLDVVADAVVGEVVEDLHGEKEAGRGHVAVPVEDALVDDLDLVGVAAGLGGAAQVVLLHLGQGGGDLDDVEAGAGVDLGVDGADVVEDVEHEGAAAGAHLEDEQVVVWVRGEAVV